jgi:hypothetical protein
MNAGGRPLGVLVLVALCLASCVTHPPQNTAPTVPPATPDQQQTTPDTQPTVPPTTPEATNPPETGQQAAEFVATEELYKKTFSEVQATIDALTGIIAAADYASWLGYLTADYVQTTGSAAALAQASSSGVLKKSGIVLKSLKDYFDNVVVKSHLQASLSEIQFVDATHVKALTQIQGTSVILYYLVHEGGRWKVGLRPTGTE